MGKEQLSMPRLRHEFRRASVGRRVLISHLMMRFISSLDVVLMSRLRHKPVLVLVMGLVTLSLF